MARNAFFVSALAGCFIASNTLAGGIFIIDDPEVDFEVIDTLPYDGLGDTGPFSTFNTIGVGSTGEVREMAEFDLTKAALPKGEPVVSAKFEVVITSIEVFGLGVPVGDTPDALSVYAYVGNGSEDVPDFQAGVFQETLDTSDPIVGTVLSFDVTSAVQEFVKNGDQWAGMAVRGEEFGLMAILENAQYPRLVITTGSPCPEDLDASGDVGFADLLILLDAWGLADVQADFDGGGVGFSDLLLQLAAWGPCA